MRVTSARGTAFGPPGPALKISMERLSAPGATWIWALAALSLCASATAPTFRASPFGSRIMMTAPSPGSSPLNSRAGDGYAPRPLDHDFLRLEHAIDHDAEDERAHLADHDEGMVPVRGRLRLDAQCMAEVEERQELLAQPQNRGAVDLLDPCLVVAARPDELDHSHLRQRETLAGALDDDGGSDRQRQRNLDGDGRALPVRRLDVDGAADLIDVGPHDIHANAAARDVRELVSGREAGWKMNLAACWSLMRRASPRR